MQAAVFERLERVLGAVRAAEEARLAEILGRHAQCLERASQLRAEAGTGGPDAAPRTEAATLLVEAHWRARLLRAAAAEEARARELEREARPQRESLARAFGRERGAGDLARRARDEARRESARRAEAAVVPQRQPPSSSDTPSGRTGSPGIA